MRGAAKIEGWTAAARDFPVIRCGLRESLVTLFGATPVSAAPDWSKFRKATWLATIVVLGRKLKSFYPNFTVMAELSSASLSSA